ncbi:hypothetical protein [Acinetobacter sp. WCHAc060025]|uniref:hypothetical protein n=1 Tax=Acinetobacter sp. WCHAc060025 TaxID=2518625 RepID=UPI001D1975A2|nr:hypothetical protein [Acinetobacter sp. WCHAc060025]
MALNSSKTFQLLDSTKSILINYLDTKTVEDGAYLKRLCDQILKIERIISSIDLEDVKIIAEIPVFNFEVEIDELYAKASPREFVENENEFQKLLEYVYAIPYGYFQEIRLRNVHLDKQLKGYCDFGLWNLHNFKFARDLINYSNNLLPYEVIKEKYHQSNLQKIELIQDKVSECLMTINTWETNFDRKKEIVVELEKKLEENKLTYDFVLLSKGFQQLYEKKQSELKERRDGYSQFGAILVCIPFTVIVAVIILILTGHETKLTSFWYLAFPITTLMLIVFYFTRVGLQHVRSVQSQMMQLELRMALCQFIHNYANDSEELHKKNKEGFEKFENIIFSPIVASDDKIPTTFDGMEQLAKLIEVVRK